MTKKKKKKWRPAAPRPPVFHAARATVAPDPKRTTSAVPPIGGTYGGRFPDQGETHEQ